MPDRIVVISDTHLGRPHCSAASPEALRPIWQGASDVLINGDVAEVHHPEHWSEAAWQTLRLFDLCEADGVRLTLLAGNHDPFISEHHHLSLAGGAVFITHGDVLHPAVAPWSPAAARIRTRYEEALASLDPERREHLESRLAVSKEASHAEWKELEIEAARSAVWRMMIRPWAIARVLHYWYRLPRLAADFLNRHAPEARFMILGHTHRPGIWTVPRAGDSSGETNETATIINTGSFGFPGTPRAVVLEDRTLSVHRIIQKQGDYHVIETPVRRFDLPEFVTRPAHDRPQEPSPDDAEVDADRPCPSTQKTRPGSGRWSAA